MIKISFGQPAVPTPQEGGLQTRHYGHPMFQSRSRSQSALTVGGVLVGAEVWVVAPVEALALQVAGFQLDVAHVGLDCYLIVVLR